MRPCSDRAVSIGSTRSDTPPRPDGCAPTRATSTRWPTTSTPDQIDRLATVTPYATGATIKDLVNEALILSIRDGRDLISWPDILRAKQLKELGLPEDVEYVERERHAVAVHEACHAVVAYRVRHHLQIDVATIEKGGSYLGHGGVNKTGGPFHHLAQRVRVGCHGGPRIARR